MKTVVLTTLAMVNPWSCKIILTFCKTRSVWARMSPATIWPDSGIYRNLPGAKKQVAHAHAVVVRAARGSGAGGFDDCFVS